MITVYIIQNERLVIFLDSFKRRKLFLKHPEDTDSIGLEMNLANVIIFVEFGPGKVTTCQRIGPADGTTLSMLAPDSYKNLAKSSSPPSVAD